MKFQIILGKLFKYFLQGLIILAPITITFWTVYSLFNWVDSILPNFIHSLFPKLALDENGNPRHIPGIGFILVIVIVLVVGYVSSSFIVSKLVELFDNILEKTPGIKIIYSTIKDFFEAFAGNKRKFDRAVLVSIESTDIWRIGFITHAESGGVRLAGIYFSICPAIICICRSSVFCKKRQGPSYYRYYIYRRYEIRHLRRSYEY